MSMPPSGLLGIHFSDTRRGEYRNISYTVRYLADPRCRNTPAVADLIGRVDPPGWFPAANQCQVLAPNELPNCAAPGDARPYEDGNLDAFLHAWGQGSDQVSMGRGREVLEQLGEEGPGFPPHRRRIGGRQGRHPSMGDRRRRPTTWTDHLQVRRRRLPLRAVDRIRHDLDGRAGVRLAVGDDSGPSWQLSQHPPLPPM